MKIIELLNKIANNEEVPKKIKYDDMIFKLNEYNCYINDNDLIFIDSLIPNLNNLNDEVEIIEDEEEIDIQSIEEVNHYNIVSAIKGKTEENIDNELKLNSLAINKLTKAVKQLEKKVNSIEQK